MAQMASRRTSLRRTNAVTMNLPVHFKCKQSAWAMEQGRQAQMGPGRAMHAPELEALVLGDGAGRQQLHVVTDLRSALLVVHNVHLGRLRVGRVEEGT